MKRLSQTSSLGLKPTLAIAVLALGAAIPWGVHAQAKSNAQADANGITGTWRTGIDHKRNPLEDNPPNYDDITFTHDGHFITDTHRGSHADGCGNYSLAGNTMTWTALEAGGATAASMKIIQHPRSYTATYFVSGDRLTISDHGKVLVRMRRVAGVGDSAASIPAMVSGSTDVTVWMPKILPNHAMLIEKLTAGRVVSEGYLQNEQGRSIGFHENVEGHTVIDRTIATIDSDQFRGFTTKVSTLGQFGSPTEIGVLVSSKSAVSFRD